mmetsp:Transcript_54427/g.126712  ORF Transcript_54427/g.126712 Transcript_54427/m.126712 type:complete len:138 (-) Transcript_54427:332-745(-)
MAVVAATMAIMRQRTFECNKPRQTSTQRFLARRSRLDDLEWSDWASEKPPWYEQLEHKLLRDGQVVALQGRQTGKNGSFAKGDIGQATWQPNGTVHIVWPDGSQTSTSWPNLAWYRGHPCAFTEENLPSGTNTSDST